MSTSRQTTGRLGEKLAADYLIQKGYSVLGHNLRTAYGEIDLLARKNTAQLETTLFADEAVLVFVEVKTRRSTGFGFPEESITEKKKAHMLAAAQAYLQSNPDLGGNWQLDVIAVQLQGKVDTEAEIVHFENILP